MSIHVDWSNPYANRNGTWLKGNLHTHTSPASLCAQILVEDCLNRYVELGYDFVSISDHFNYKPRVDDRITIIPGLEWNAVDGGSHTGIYAVNGEIVKAAIDISEHSELLNYMSMKDALVILNHPNWQLRPHYRREEMLAATPYDGIEIYNGVIERLDGYSIATDKWDFLLAKGRRVLGFASDDSHAYGDIGLASIHVRSKSRNGGDIMSAIKSGNFYCSSGVTIHDISMANGVIELSSPDAQEIQVRADGGTLIKRVMGNNIKVNMADYNVGYLRFALYGTGSAMAWTQPFFK